MLDLKVVSYRIELSLKRDEASLGALKRVAQKASQPVERFFSDVWFWMHESRADIEAVE